MIQFTTDLLPLKRRIAECLYGAPDQDFTLTLHRRKVEKGGASLVDLVVSPAPVKGDLALTVCL